MSEKSVIGASDIEMILNKKTIKDLKQLLEMLGKDEPHRRKSGTGSDSA